MSRKKLDKSLHWTTFYSEKLLLAVIGALTMFARHGCLRNGNQHACRTR